MKTFVKHLLTLTILVLTGCADHVDDGPEKVGRLFLSVEIDPTLRMPDGSVSEITAAHNLDAADVSLTLVSMSGEYSHTWTSLADFEQGDDYYTGLYFLSGDAGKDAEQGFETPRFTGSATVDIGDRRDGLVNLVLTAGSSFFTVTYTSAFTSAFPGAFLSLQGGKSQEFSFPAGEDRMLCLDPAEIDGYITLPDGVRFRGYSIPATKSGTIYQITVDAGNSDGVDYISIFYPGAEPQKTLLTPEFLASEGPTVEINGLESFSLSLPEGESATEPVIGEIKAPGAKLKRVIFTTNSASLARQGVPAQTDLLSLHPQNVLDSLGLRTSLNADGGTIDLTEFLGSLVYLEQQNAVSTFSLMAEDVTGRVSNLSTLTVTTTPIDLKVVEVTEAVMGADQAEITIDCSATDFASRVVIETADADSIWHPLTPENIISVSPGRYRLTVNVGEGSTDVAMRIVYCDEVRATFSVKRRMPEFSLIVDAYAAFANILVEPKDPALTGKIISRVRVYVDNKPYNLYQTTPEKRILTIIGLSPATTYSVKATMMDESAPAMKFCTPVSFTTETTPQLFNADFEERRDGPVYTDLPSGGLFSQTTVEIFNRQHKVSYNLRIPKGWTTVNDKTFNLRSTNHNTWYMQPSTYSLTSPVQNGTFSCELQTVGFDPDGEKIPPYAQTGAPYLDYSPVVPRIKFKAAGKLFLGNYSFDPSTMTETYSEGISWGSRPMSINGYYIFSPCDDDRSDTGLVMIEVLGNVDGEGETVIASGRLELPLCTGWKAFSLPLMYSHFGVKARRLKVMFASSRHAGSIGEESASIITTIDPVSATSKGGRLSLDNVYLSY
ncbi:MAG: PCMD domain-containing protein [Duncaniella sp.]|nr:PCMD domain-containing protein [Duncaniella sp.]